MTNMKWLKNWTKLVLTVLIWAGVAVYGSTPTFAQALSVAPDKPAKSETGMSFPKETYLLDIMGNGWAPDGTSIGIRAYSSHDGTRVSLACGTFASRGAANRYFRSEMDKAMKVVEKGPKRGPHGAVIGQRAVLLTTSAGSDSSMGVIAWTEGKRSCTINSPRLALALDFETRLD
jgi:hypothetical protein